MTHRGRAGGGQGSPSPSGSLPISWGAGRGCALSVSFTKLGSPLGEGATEGKDVGSCRLSRSEGGRRWPHKSKGSCEVRTLGLLKSSRVLWATVTRELAECLPEGEREAQGWRQRARELCRLCRGLACPAPAVPSRVGVSASLGLSSLICQDGVAGGSWSKYLDLAPGAARAGTGLSSRAGAGPEPVLPRLGWCPVPR